MTTITWFAAKKKHAPACARRPRLTALRVEGLAVMAAALNEAAAGIDAGLWLQPFSPRQRRAVLAAIAYVRALDTWTTTTTSTRYTRRGGKRGT